MKHKFLSSFFMVLVVMAIVSMTASGAATTKSLSTNFTLVNLGSNEALVSVDYIRPDGTPWTDSAFTENTIPADGGQWIVRQYFDPGLTAGKGSVVVSSSEELGALVQIINRTGTPTSGAYAGFNSGSQLVYIPQVARNGSSATGTANSQIMIQNTGTAPVSVTMTFYQGSSTPANSRTSPIIQVGATFFYDLSDDVDTPALTNGWYSVELDAGTGGSIAAVLNTFFGAHSLMTSNGFPADKVDSKWYIPLLYSKLNNTLNTSLVIQNLDTVEIPADDIVLDCGSFTLPYTRSVPVKGSANFNTFAESRFPTNFQGGCNVRSLTGKQVVVLIMYRYINGSDQAAYEAVPASSTDTTVFVPLIAKRLSNYFATAATIQNLSDTATAHITITYTPSGGGTPVVRTGLEIAPGASLVRNFRNAATELPEITDGWQGTMKVESDTPIAAYVANTYLTVNGDQFMAYLGLTQP